MLIDQGSHQQQKEPVLVLEGPEEGAMDSSPSPPHSLPSTGNIKSRYDIEGREPPGQVHSRRSGSGALVLADDPGVQQG